MDWTVTKSKTFVCPICKVPEPVVSPISESRRILLTCSTMYGVWDQANLPSNIFHLDMDSIVGGRVRDMTVALKANYLHLPNRLEIIVIAGINNIGAGEKAEDIIKEMKELKDIVKKHSEEFGHC